MTARPANPAALATLIGGSVDPNSHPHEPRIFTDSGTVRLSPRRGWHLCTTGYVPPPLGRWDASAEDIAEAFFAVTKEVAA